jgi:hypothetical protein
LLFLLTPSTFSTDTLLSPLQECHPFYPSSLSHDLVVSSLFEELLVSQVVQQEALTRLFIEKGVFTKRQFLEMVKAVDREMGQKKNL